MSNDTQILVSAADMEDPVFHHAVILLTQQDASGATGFIINQLFPRRLNDLVEFHHCKSWPLHLGGPVENEKLFFIHRRPDLVEEGIPLHGDYYLGGNFKQAIEYINNNTLREEEILLFVGYCGWDAGELQAEIKEGSWLPKTISADILKTPATLLWKKLSGS